MATSKAGDDAGRSADAALSGPGDREREQQAVAGVHAITSELHALVELRGRVTLAITLLSRDGNVELALKALRGEQLW